MRFFTLATAAALAAIARAEVTTIFETYGVCQSDILTTVPLTVAATTTTVTTTLPLTTTVSVYPVAARDAFQAEITPFPKRAGELEQRDLTEIHSWVCTQTTTETHFYYSEVTTPGTATKTATAFESTSTYTLCIPGHICVG
ncbi:hypothetical protein PENSPDRAFT_757846 [Peniophora sp. CONT]|nr:hypothetical protein PENSPDRAFT_757846 [Peniophora sp. CONT]